MRPPLFTLIALLCLTSAIRAQREDSVRHEIFGDYTFLSNSLNGLPGSRQPLNGWEVGVAFPSWNNLRFKFDISGYRGTNLGAAQQPLYLLAGAQYDFHLRKETLFAEGLAGEGGANKNWGPNNAAAELPSLAAIFGGGLDTPLTRRISFRVSGDYQYSNFALKGPGPNFFPYRPPGLPNNFARISTGLVWLF